MTPKEHATAIRTAPKFSVGDRVISSAFVDCFGKAIQAVHDLVVTNVQVVETQHIPSYDLISTAYPNGHTAVIASARFFEPESDLEMERRTR